MSVVWGIDVGTKRIAFGTTNGRSESVEIARGKGGERLYDARTKTWHMARELAADEPPLCVFMEAPAGNPRPHPSLIQMCGVATEAIYAALANVYRHPVTVFEIPVASWKKLALGRGNATKGDVMEWAEAAGLRPANQDEADALAIAQAGFLRVSVQGELVA